MQVGKGLGCCSPRPSSRRPAFAGRACRGEHAHVLEARVRARAQADGADCAGAADHADPVLCPICHSVRTGLRPKPRLLPPLDRVRFRRGWARARSGGRSGCHRRFLSRHSTEHWDPRGVGLRHRLAAFFILTAVAVWRRWALSTFAAVRPGALLIADAWFDRAREPLERPPRCAGSKRSPRSCPGRGLLSRFDRAYISRRPRVPDRKGCDLVGVLEVAADGRSSSAREPRHAHAVAQAIREIGGSCLSPSWSGSLRARPRERRSPRRDEGVRRCAGRWAQRRRSG